MVNDGRSSTIPWPVWAAVTLLTAAITAFAAMHGGRDGPSDERPADPQGPSDLEATYGPEVKAVIQRSMAVGTHAYLNSDTSSLPQVFTGEALKTIIAEVNRFTGQGIRLNRQITHTEFEPISFTRDPLRAQVRVARRMEGDLELISTGVCQEALPSVFQEHTYYLERKNGAWMIYSIEAHTPSPTTVPCS